MNQFEVSFFYKDKQYIASVQKIIVHRPKYVVVIGDAGELAFQHELSFSAPRHAEMLGWVEIHDHPKLMPTIAMAIIKYAAENKIDLFKN